MDYDRLRELQQKYDENPRRYFAPLANEYRKGGQLKRAIDICRAQLAEMPGHMSGQIVFGQALYESGEFEEARKVFERAIALDPENLIALRSLGDMSLQAGDMGEARTWYTRLLDADPKDTAVIALVTEIDAASDGAPVPMAEEIPGVDSDAGDQEIPALQHEAEKQPPAEPQLAGSSESREPESNESRQSESTEIAAMSSPPPVPMNSEVAAAEALSAPDGLERHYPISEIDTKKKEADPLPPPSLTREELGVPIGNSAAEGLKSMKEDVNAFPWSPPPVPETSALRRPSVPEPVAAPKPVAAPEPIAAPEPVAEAEAVASKEPVREPEPAAAREIFAASESVASPEPAAPERVAAAEKAHEPVTGASTVEKTFSAPSGEPFVNETMAQLYLQQGYKQLALKVYRQLAESRPDDASLQSRIAEIEAEDVAAHPVDDRPAFDRTPIASAPAREPLREREPIETPRRDEPRAEPEQISSRQPSIREFFATLGRRKPPRTSSSGGGSQGASHGGGNNQPADTTDPLGAAPPSASLDTVFAGATVSPSDARAASRLAGAFSGASGASRTPPTPPMPTPRVNPRVPQAQESEEDVAKFRAWLDGLTGE